MDDAGTRIPCVQSLSTRRLRRFFRAERSTAISSANLNAASQKRVLMNGPTCARSGATRSCTACRHISASHSLHQCMERLVVQLAGPSGSTKRAAIASRAVGFKPEARLVVTPRRDLLAPARRFPPASRVQQQNCVALARWPPVSVRNLRPDDRARIPAFDKASFGFLREIVR